MSPFVRETIDRAWKTGLQFILGSTVLASFLQSLAAGELKIDADAWGAVVLGAVGVVLSVATSALSRLVGDDTANLIPPSR